MPGGGEKVLRPVRNLRKDSKRVTGHTASSRSVWKEFAVRGYEPAVALLLRLAARRVFPYLRSMVSTLRQIPVRLAAATLLAAAAARSGGAQAFTAPALTGAERAKIAARPFA